MKKARPKSAWACIERRGNCFNSCGNGSQSQYPIFPTQKQARDWMDEANWRKSYYRISKVIISEK